MNGGIVPLKDVNKKVETAVLYIWKKIQYLSMLTWLVIVDSLACVAGGIVFAIVRVLAARLQFSPFRREKQSARLRSSFLPKFARANDLAGYAGFWLTSKLNGPLKSKNTLRRNWFSLEYILSRNLTLGKG